MNSSTLGFAVSLGALVLYSCSLYTLYTPRVLNGFDEVIPKEGHIYGHLKFLTVQCLIIQLVSALLHVLAHFIKPLRACRDVVFTTLAVPVGAVVVVTFWVVYFGVSREDIFPKKLDSFYPFWLNQTNHTVPVPVNLLLALLIRHEYRKYGEFVAIVYLLGYTVFLQVFRMQAGAFVYPYLDKMSEIQRLLYYAVTASFSWLSYKFGHLISILVHDRGDIIITSKPPFDA